MTKHQKTLITQLFKMLEINIDNNHYNNYAPYDLYLEEECIYGKNCIYINNPLICSKNHHNINIIIRKDNPIPKNMCIYECPWKILNCYPMRCNNINCTYAHLAGRSYLINNYIAYNNNYKFL